MLSTSFWTASHAIVFLTFVLAGTTMYYAWQAQRTVNEMRDARRAAIAPTIVPTMYKMGGGNMFPRVVNAGTGPALDLDVVLSLEPSGPSNQYRSPYMAPGRSAGLHFNDDHGVLISQAEAFGRFELLRLVGHSRDAEGQTHVIDETYPLGEYIVAFQSNPWAPIPTTRKQGYESSDVIAEALVNIEELMRYQIEG